MIKFDLNNKKFTALFNSAHGQVNQETVFSYFQDKTNIWAFYSGGDIRIGTLSGFYSKENELTFRYGHWDSGGDYRSGHCKSTLTMQDDGRVRISEDWMWDDESERGRSTLIEIL